MNKLKHVISFTILSLFMIMATGSSDDDTSSSPSTGIDIFGSSDSVNSHHCIGNILPWYSISAL